MKNKVHFRSGKWIVWLLLLTLVLNRMPSMVQVYAEDGYRIIIAEKITHGSVYVQDNVQTVTEKGSYTVHLIPDKGYDLKELIVDKIAYIPESLTFQADGSYIYKVENVTQDQMIDAVFIKREERNIKELSEADIEITAKEGNSLVSPEDNVYVYKDAPVQLSYIGEATVTGMGYTDYEGNSVYQMGSRNIEVNNSIKITAIHLFSEGQWMDIHIPGVIIAYDMQPPVITIDELPWKKDAPVTVTGKIQDGGVEIDGKIYASDWKQMYWYELNSQSRNPLEVDREGNFYFEVSPLANGMSNYCVYAEDKLGNASDRKANAIVKYDDANPAITDISFEAEHEGAALDMSSKYGIVSFDNINVNIRAGDVDSGIREITVYKGNDVLGRLKGNTDDKIVSGTVTLKRKDFEEGARILIECEDNAGNKIRKYPSEINSMILNDTILIEKAAFRFEWKIISAENTQNQLFTKRKDGVYYSDNDNIVLTYEIEPETDYGKVLPAPILNEVVFSNNGKEVRSTLLKGEIKGSDLALAPGKNKLDVQIYGTTTGKKNLFEEEENKPPVIYIDKEAPDITHFTFSHKENIGADQIPLDSIFENSNPFEHGGVPDFGIYYNETVEVSVKADDGEGVGASKVVLELENIGQKMEADINDDGEAVFELAENLFLINGKYQEGKLKAYAIDIMGNTSEEKTEPTSKNSNMKAAGMMLESAAPSVDFHMEEPVYQAEGLKWYGKDVPFSFQISDEDSGIYRVKVEVNGEAVIEENKKYKAEKIGKDTFSLNTNQVLHAEDGKYVIQAVAVDNAGNETIHTETIYIDSENPYIAFIKIDGREDANPAVEKKDYGWFFKEKTKVTIHAKDQTPSSGIREITYYLQGADGNKSDEKVQKADKNGEISFIVEADFKGQIYASVTDCVNHSQEIFVTPDSLVIESPSSHDKVKHIEIKMPETKQKDVDNLALYKKDINATVTVSDYYSGIQKVEYSLEAPYSRESNQKGIVAMDSAGNLEILGDEKKEVRWKKTKKDRNLATELTGTFPINHNSNDIVLKIVMTDCAGNSTTKSVRFSIDKVNPKIQVTYDNNRADREFTDNYRKKRTATVTVTERNFDAKDFVSKIKNRDGKDSFLPGVDLTGEESWTVKKDKENPDRTTYTAKVSFEQGGDFIWDMAYKDLAGNAAEKPERQKFIVDMTPPVISVKYNDVKSHNGEYYGGGRTAVITIQEHHFDESRVKLTKAAKKDGRSISFPKMSGWTSNKDVHTATINFSSDGDYAYSLHFQDMAGNKADKYGKDSFTVDTERPNINISGVKNKSANKKAVAPVITFSDVNMDTEKTKFKLFFTSRDGKETPVKGIENWYKITEQENSIQYTFRNIKRSEKTDGCYVLKAETADMAGNIRKQKIEFSVNRFGSVYKIDKALNNTSIQTERDVVITEINPDKFKEEKTRVKLTKNGIQMDLVASRDYSLERKGGKENQWCMATYRINKSLFAGDGRYSVNIYTKDAAGNNNDNGAEGKKASIEFIVDKTAPEITPVDLVDETQYPLDNKEVSISVKDNLILDKVSVYLNNQEIPYTVEGDNYIILIPGNSEKQNLKITAVDSAGNEFTKEVKEFLVTTNLFVRWYNNLPIFVGTLVVIGLLVLAVLVVILVKVNRKRVIKAKED